MNCLENSKEIFGEMYVCNFYKVKFTYITSHLHITSNINSDSLVSGPQLSHSATFPSIVFMAWSSTIYQGHNLLLVAFALCKIADGKLSQTSSAVRCSFCYISQPHQNLICAVGQILCLNDCKRSHTAKHNYVSMNSYVSIFMGLSYLFCGPQFWQLKNNADNPWKFNSLFSPVVPITTFTVSLTAV